MQAVAYVNHGRWLADCPTGCNAAMDTTVGETGYLCGVPYEGRIIGGCGASAPLVWPEDPNAITAALSVRPTANRHWAPAGHRQTYVSYTPDGRLIAEAYPNGQTVADLIAEWGA